MPQTAVHAARRLQACVGLPFSLAGRLWAFPSTFNLPSFETMAHLCHQSTSFSLRAQKPREASRLPCASPPLVAPRTAAAVGSAQLGRCNAVNPKSAVESLKSLKPQGARQAVVDPVYTAASDYLKTLGLVNLSEINRVLDISMNPNSLFLSQSKNSNARPLDVQEDIRPVVEFFLQRKVSLGDVIKIISGHPPVLSYKTDQLENLWEYMESIGMPDVATALVKRPNILGLDVDKSLRKIVEYLQYVETPPETIVKYLAESI